MFDNSQFFSGGGDFYSFPIEQSLRFDDTAYLEWNPESSGDQNTWTVSFWFKRGLVSGSRRTLFSAGAANNLEGVVACFIDENYRLDLAVYNSGGQEGRIISNAKLRDPSAWYHFVLVVDAGNGTANDRMRMYINGERVTSLATNDIIENQSWVGRWNRSGGNMLINRYSYSNNLHEEGYYADFYNIDGQALDASSFGETKSGVWIPKEYSGSYGTNGFRLSFADDAEVEAFNTVLYRGNGGTQSVTGMGFQPDLVWVKSRTTASHGALFDPVRGSTSILIPSLTNAESVQADGSIQSFDADGFTLNSDVSTGTSNFSGRNYVAWGWKAGGSSNTYNIDGTGYASMAAAGLTDGSVAVTGLSVSTTYGFSISTFNSGSSGTQSFAHGLGTTPSLCIFKERNSGGAGDHWVVWEGMTGNPATSYGYLNLTNAFSTDTSQWSNTAPTSTTFTFNSGYAWSTSQNMIAYCWAEKAGYSKFGSYEGSNSAVNVTGFGFTPAFVLIKAADTAQSWVIFDNTRDVPEPQTNVLFADGAFTEESNPTNRSISFTSDGFTVNSTTQFINGSGNGTFIYAAFADTREAAFWLDQSGNDNDWQPVNLDHNDTVADSPTDNFCTWNPLSNTGTTLANGNLDFSGGINSVCGGTLAVTSGKWYWECSIQSTINTNNPFFLGFTSANTIVHENYDQGVSIYSDNGTNNLIRHRQNNSYSQSITIPSAMQSFSIGDVIQFAYDGDTGKIWVGVDNTWADNSGGTTGNPSAGTNPTFTLSDTDIPMTPIKDHAGPAWSGHANFGQLDYEYTPPTGYLALSTANLPEPAISPADDESPSDYFGTLLWSGDDNATRTVAVGQSGITGDVNFTPDFTWVKRRNGATNGSDHMLLDAVRGVGTFNALSSNGIQVEGFTAAGSAWTNFGDIDSFTTDGFVVQKGSDPSHTLEGINQTGGTYVGWNWLAGNSTSSNTDGSVTSTVSVNTESGFSIVNWTAPASGYTVGHGLNQAPDMIILRGQDQVTQWWVWHTGLSNPAQSFILLNNTTAATGNASAWNNTPPTATVFSTLAGYIISAGYKGIAYCFHSVEGFSKFGSFELNNNADGPFVYLGFRPAFVITRRIDGAGDWNIFDSTRDAFNDGDLDLLQANTTTAESAFAVSPVDLLSNGFKLRHTSANGYINTATDTAIYMAFAENPFKYSNAR